MCSSQASIRLLASEYTLRRYLEHVRHYAVVRQRISRFQIFLELQCTADQTLFLLIDLDFDVVLNRCVNLRLEHLDVLV